MKINELTILPALPSNSQGRTSSRHSTLPSNLPEQFIRLFKFDGEFEGKVEWREEVLPWELEGSAGKILHSSNLKRISSILLTLLFLPTSLLSQNDLANLSLDEFLILAKNNSIASDIAKLDVAQADLNYTIFKAGLKPRLTGTVNFPNFANTFSEVSQPDGSISFPRINNNNSSLGLQLTQAVAKTGGTLFARSDLQRFDDFSSDAVEKVFYNGTPFQVGFFQPLFGFNELKWNQKIEPLRLAEANKKYIADIEAINLEAAELFSNLLIAHENLSIAISNKESNETLYGLSLIHI